MGWSYFGWAMFRSTSDCLIAGIQNLKLRGGRKDTKQGQNRYMTDPQRVQGDVEMGNL